MLAFNYLCNLYTKPMQPERKGVSRFIINSHNLNNVKYGNVTDLNLRMKTTKIKKKLLHRYLYKKDEHQEYKDLCNTSGSFRSCQKTQRQTG